ncbi:pentatricopeptide repeat-containing protein At2g29760, chloroplastic-like [Nicotiana tomentosiformis]|uniref:pentatricopeptide repeat-containing protein At2g29760, chloroplastic-like n=1 Tax=Nicotiana tomentosiformis TaxID=4098 RepID=UPI00051C4682|nr:pentatricopeptide repeat-containing protein At2g29760, chloroplastic-like [Nicotiana tomentosiformis]XP_018632244.1 pentatricopeptide repeat-containing protein At2g29760, chloroplastic-like [Nicotiana tomentosiformis]XP_018632245.1 pentatricopeptide repeat-containing protein At2g29760, chloroplastic-like [Nicotiana tomentosiformis]XP_018632246.1 pentatricopeptide repeat-containing protein At2g29760, chloroplastic-like [Nicotiana tomentosiformis]XP_018632247.1 pentatricopeptide repeat-contain
MAQTMQFIKSKSIAHSCFNFTRSFSDFSSLSNLLQGCIPHNHLLQIHARVFRIGAHQDNLIATRLIGQYPSNISLRVLRGQLKKPNLFPFNAIIRVLSEEGNFTDAFLVFNKLRYQSLLPNQLTFSFLLKACSRSGNSYYVQQVHSLVLKLRLGDEPSLCKGLLGVYARSLRELHSARKLFDEMPDKDVVSWTCLISGYAKLGLSEEALCQFLSMVNKSLIPENDTMVSVLSACSKLDMSNIEKWVGNFLYDLGSSGCDSVSIVLCYLYGKWGKVDKSREIFEQISGDGKRSVLPWNAMIGAYVQNGCALEGLSLFQLMMELNCCCPNHVTMVNVLSACAQVGNLYLGLWVHEYMKGSRQKGFLLSNANLATALIDMYSKCGSLEKAGDVFDQLVVKDVVSFNAMIMGLAINGKGMEALKLFSQMLELNLRPNARTFLGLLCACSHSGLTAEGRQIFKEMSQCFCIAPRLEHYASYIDLLARVGYVEEALQVATSMPFKPNNFVWGALLGGCMLHNRLELAQIISSILVEMDPNNSAGYVMLSNTYASDQRWSAISRLRLSMKEKGVAKMPGCSWINIAGVVHEFLAGSSSHPQNESMHSILQVLLKEMKLASI